MLVILHVSFFSVLWNKEAPSNAVQVHCGTVCALAQVHLRTLLTVQFIPPKLLNDVKWELCISWGIIMQIFSMIHVPNPLKPLLLLRIMSIGCMDLQCFSLANPLKLLYLFWGIMPLVKLEHLSTGLIHMVRLQWTSKLRNQPSYLEICSFWDPQ